MFEAMARGTPMGLMITGYALAVAMKCNDPVWMICLLGLLVSQAFIRPERSAPRL